MKRADLIIILSDVNAPAHLKEEAQREVDEMPREERIALMREITDAQAARQAELASASGKPFPEAFDTSLSNTVSPACSGTDTLPLHADGQSGAVPSCINLQDASDWPDEDIPLHEVWEYFRRDGVGDAMLYCRLNRYRITWVKDWNKILVWQGHYWTNDDFGVAFQRCEAVVKQYHRLLDEQQAICDDPASTKEEAQDAMGQVQNIRKRIRTLRSNLGQKNLLDQITHVPNPLLILPSYIDTVPHLLPCPNGVVNQKTGVFKPGRPQDWLRVASKTRFNPALLEVDDPCPETNRFLLASMNGKQELVDYIWRILGWGVLRSKHDKFFVFWGPHGRNGKDTLIKLIGKVLGNDLSGSINIEMLLQGSQIKNSSAPSPDVLALKGMAIAWGNEAEEGQRFAMNKVKEYSGDGNISARGLMDKAMTTFKQTHLLIMCTNELPKAKADDDAFWTRFQVIRWELSFVDDPTEDYHRLADRHLDEKLEAELEGVLARIVRGAMEYTRDGLNTPEIVKQWNRDVRSTYDDLTAFLNECCEIEPKRDNVKAYMTSISAKDLNTAWGIWYAENRDRRHIPSGKTLGAMLDKREIPKKLSNGTWRLGLMLKEEWAKRVDDEQSRGARRD